MALSLSRIALIGETPYAHEKEAIDFAVEQLPNSDPYHVWALVDLLDASSGRLHEIDLLVLGYSALYLVEIKSGPGLYTGNSVDWWRQPPGGTPRYMDPPLRSTNLKAKVLKSRLRAKMDDPRDTPWVEPLVFLSNADATEELDREGLIGVVLRNGFLDAVKNHKFPGADPRVKRSRIDRPRMRAIVKALAAVGARKREGKAHVGSYELGETLADGPGYQDRMASHRDNPKMRRRARTYLVPSQTSVERRQRLRRAADREAQLLYDVREHANVLQCLDYVTDAPLGPTVLFDAFDDAVPLSAFVRQHAATLTLHDRGELVRQVALALSYCHKKGILHGALTPDAVLARRHPDTGALETRLYNFQLGAGEEVEGTSHYTSLVIDAWGIYQAPEYWENPANRTAQADIFSLGAIAYLVFTGRAPGENLVESNRRLARSMCLDPSIIDDSIPAGLAKAVAFATAFRFADRPDDAGAWAEILLEELTEPEAAATEVEAAPALDPLKAVEGDELEHGLLVLGGLGQGATARVLHVMRESDGREFALKVSIAPDHDERLGQESEALKSLTHPRIVQCEQLLVVAERTCLLLSLAGKETLHRNLSREGSISLDYASRYGEDLLSALEHLEEQSPPVQHRDIKPANLGVGSASKKTLHLTLFDFSLVDAPASNIQLGTAAYRDPFLRERGAWDSAADRWGAAITLHEMLTGIRPHFGGRGGSALDEDAPLQLAAERFDPSVRDRLIEFFQRALARTLEARHATATEMRLAWNACFTAAAETKASAAHADAPSAPKPTDYKDLDDAALAAIATDATIESLPLSLRARNALDRAGLSRADELLSLPDNRLSAIRGIGSKVAKDIFDFRDRWRDLRELSPAAATPMFPGYRGEDALVATTGVAAVAASALSDAGLHTLAAVASAPEPQLAALAHRHGFDLVAVRRVLDDENRRAGERDRPSTVEGWLAALLPGRAKGDQYLHALFGTAEPFEGRLDVTPRDVAKHFDVTPPNVYVALGRARERWQKHRAIGELVDACHQIVADAGGAVRLADAADALRGRMPHDRAATDELVLARAAALLRVVAEVEKDESAGVSYIRLRDDAPWLALSDEHAQVVRRLGDAADELATRTVLASSGETDRVFSQVVAETPLAALAADRIAELAAVASRRAARSSRNEIYPRSLTPTRALELSTSVLIGELSPEDVHRRVAARYPAAAALPLRPDLDALLETHGLHWYPESGKYRRRGEDTSHHTVYARTVYASSVTRARTQSEGPSPELVERGEFGDRMRNAIERAHLRILSVTADRAAQAARAMVDNFGVHAVSFDAVFAAELHRQVKAKKVRADIYAADLHGPSEPGSWKALCKLAGITAAQVAATLLPPTEPLLLTNPGLIARYGLDEFLRAFVAASKDRGAAAMFLLVPGHDTGGMPRINGTLPMPGILPSQALRIPTTWIAGAAKQAA